MPSSQEAWAKIQRLYPFCILPIYILIVYKKWIYKSIKCTFAHTNIILDLV